MVLNPDGTTQMTGKVNAQPVGALESVSATLAKPLDRNVIIYPVVQLLGPAHRWRDARDAVGGVHGMSRQWQRQAVVRDSFCPIRHMLSSMHCVVELEQRATSNEQRATVRLL